MAATHEEIINQAIELIRAGWKRAPLNGSRLMESQNTALLELYWKFLTVPRVVKLFCQFTVL